MGGRFGGTGGRLAPEWMAGFAGISMLRLLVYGVDYLRIWDMSSIRLKLRQLTDIL